tara:strand:+ start:116 stop:862 length:747 start_codon:yes stop_codon:yes gene_type:complete
MAAGKFGPGSGLLMVDGYNMLSNKITGLTEKATSQLVETTGIGDTFYETAPTGLTTVEVTQEGAFFDTTTNYSHDAFSGSVPASPQATARVICLGFAGQTSGYPMVGFAGTYTQDYEVVAEMGNLQKANVTYEMTGQRDAGLILQPLAAQTDSWDTTSSPVDNSASTSGGGVGYIQCTAASGFSGFIGKVRHSADNVTYSDLLSFTNNVSAPFAERVSVSGTVNRYLSFTGIITGTGSITVFCGFSRS